MEKEQRSKSYADESYDSLSAEKTRKMHAFVKDFARSLLKKLADRGELLTRDRHPQGPPGMTNSDHTSSFSPRDDKLATDMRSLSPINSQPANNDVNTSTTVMNVRHMTCELQFTEQVAGAALCTSPSSRHLYNGHL